MALFARFGGPNRCSLEYFSHAQDMGGATTLAEIVGADTGGPGGRRLGKDDHTPEDYRLFVDFILRMLDYKYVP